MEDLGIINDKLHASITNKMKCAVSAFLVGYGTGAYDPWAPAADNFSISSISV